MHGTMNVKWSNCFAAYHEGEYCHYTLYRPLQDFDCPLTIYSTFFFFSNYAKRPIAGKPSGINTKSKYKILNN
jgi:hypothetical protein